MMFLRKKPIFSFSLVFFLLIVFEAGVLTSVSSIINSDIVYEDSIFRTVWDLLNGLFQFVWFWIAYGCLLFVITKKGFSSSWGYIFLYSGFVAIRYFSNLAVGCIFLGWEDFIESFIFTVLDILLCLLQTAVILGIYYYIFRYCKNKLDFSIEHIFDKKKPLQKAAFFASLLPAAFRILSRGYYDIFFFGAPKDVVDLLWMIFYYSADFAFILIGYLFILLWITALSKVFSYEDLSSNPI